MKNLSVKEDTLEGSYSHKTTFVQIEKILGLILCSYVKTKMMTVS